MALNPHKPKSRKPANPRLWHMLTVQAQAKFHPFPSLAASRWIHQEYVKKGGRFLDFSDEKDEKQHGRNHEFKHGHKKNDDK